MSVDAVVLHYRWTEAGDVLPARLQTPFLLSPPASVPLSPALFPPAGPAAQCQDQTLDNKLPGIIKGLNRCLTSNTC